MAEERHLERLRELMTKHGIGFYLVLAQDAHNSEYVCVADKRREFVSGFSGSAGTAIVGTDGYLELATDGRYWLQAGLQLGSDWTLRKEGSPGVATWSKAISERAKTEGVAIGVDPALISYDKAASIINSGATLKAVEPNLVDQVWPSRPAEPAAPIYGLSTTITGQTAASKVADLRHKLVPAKADAIVLSALDQVAWLLNLRGSDIAYNPVFKSYIVVSQTSVELYVTPEHPLETSSLPDNIVVKPYSDIFRDVSRRAALGERIWVPPHSSWAMAEAAGSLAVLDRASPVELAKAAKNAIEVSGAKRAQLLCGKSVVQLLSWVSQQLQNCAKITEYDVSIKLLEFRKQLPDFRGLSFATISSTGPNAAIIHYSPPEEGSRLLSTKEVFLLDSGCQFTFGTTDTTRTAWFGAPEDVPRDVRLSYTLVLKGHIALAKSVFPKGTPGYKLDPLARQYLWRYGLDYAHGTGHGVGSFLNVHEGPIGISSSYSPESVALPIGGLLSNEPGFYQTDEYGIRIESLVVVKSVDSELVNGNSFLQFETITLVPLDRNLIDTDLLCQDELDWINNYHKTVRKYLEPELRGDSLEYLLYHTAKLSK